MIISSYSSPFNLGHKALAELFSGPVVAQEKIDGSQISFRKDEDGLSVAIRSRNQIINPSDPGMFHQGVETIRALASLLTPGYSYRGEYLQKPKHNTLPYGRIPKGHIILFDVDKGDQDYMEPNELAGEGLRIGLEVVPLLDMFRTIPTMDQVQALLDRESILGGCQIEGVVFKNYALYGSDHKALMGKYVAEGFKEKHSKDWKDRNPSGKDFVTLLAGQYVTEARWIKAIQHLREQGILLGEMKDIPALLQEINRDVLEECGEEIREALFKRFWKDISRQLTKGLPEFYKALLAEEVLGG